MKTAFKYNRLFCLVFALGLTLFASKEVIFEVGHFLSHAYGYVTHSTSFHSHHFHDDIKSHSHSFLTKAQKVTDKLEGNNTTAPNTSKKSLNLDQFKLICNASDGQIQQKLTHHFEFYYIVNSDQEYSNLPSHPPKLYA